MSTIFADIEKSLQIKTNSISGKPYIDFEGTETYTPVLGTRFWRVTNNPGRSDTMTAGNMQRHTGIYWIDVFQPTELGLKALMIDIDKIYTAFNSPVSLVYGDASVAIYGVSRGSVQREPAWLHANVQIEYVCYH